jgi:selenide, water dikinase
VADRSGVCLVLEADRLPLYPGALEAAAAGVRTGGDPRNRDYLAGHVEGDVDAAIEALVYDPQTSGGLLAAVDPASVDDLAEVGFVPVGRVEDGPAGVTLSP